MNYEILVVFVFLQSCLIGFNSNIIAKQRVQLDKLETEIKFIKEKN